MEVTEVSGRAPQGACSAHPFKLTLVTHQARMNPLQHSASHCHRYHTANHSQGEVTARSVSDSHPCRKGGLLPKPGSGTVEKQTKKQTQDLDPGKTRKGQAVRWMQICFESIGMDFLVMAQCTIRGRASRWRWIYTVSSLHHTIFFTYFALLPLSLHPSFNPLNFLPQDLCSSLGLECFFLWLTSIHPSDLSEMSFPVRNCFVPPPLGWVSLLCNSYPFIP